MAGPGKGFKGTGTGGGGNDEETTGSGAGKKSGEDLEGVASGHTGKPQEEKKCEKIFS